MNLIKRIKNWAYHNLDIKQDKRSLNIDNDTDADSSGMRITVPVPNYCTIEEIRKTIFNNPWYIPGSPVDLKQNQEQMLVSFGIISRFRQKQVTTAVQQALSQNTSE